MRIEEARRLREVEERQAEAARAFWSGEPQVVSNHRFRIPLDRIDVLGYGNWDSVAVPTDVSKRQKKEKPLPKRRIRIKK